MEKYFENFFKILIQMQDLKILWRAKKKRRDHLNYPSVAEWINTMWSIHTMEYYSALKRNGLTHDGP